MIWIFSCRRDCDRRWIEGVVETNAHRRCQRRQGSRSQHAIDHFKWKHGRQSTFAVRSVLFIHYASWIIQNAVWKSKNDLEIIAIEGVQEDEFYNFRILRICLDFSRVFLLMLWQDLQSKLCSLCLTITTKIVRWLKTWRPQNKLRIAPSWTPS